MRTANNWTDYTIIDTSDGEKLETWGNISQIIWKTDKTSSLWNTADGHYHRSNSGGGKWSLEKKFLMYGT